VDADENSQGSPRDTKVGDSMRTDVAIAAASAGIEDLARLLDAPGRHVLWVVDNEGNLLGYVGGADVHRSDS
jgi:CBS-domain-containing membrane protein